MSVAYLDYAAGAPLLPAARTAMEQAWTQPGNPSSAHACGRAARRVVENARDSIAADLGARPDEIVFCSGGTEANNLALLGTKRAHDRPRIAISAVEHASVAKVADVWREVDVLGVDASGRVRLSGFDPQTGLVSIQWVNSETGVVQPVARVVELGHGAGSLVHADAVAALGHVDVDFAGSGLDLMTVTAHKVGGPVGVGALVVRAGVEVGARGFGGGQEAGLRSGTVPVALCAGFAAAVRVAVADLKVETARLSTLHDRLIDGVSRIDGTRANCDRPCSPAIVNVTFAGVRADDLALLLDRAGFCCSTGPACSSGVPRPSEVLLAMGRMPADASASLRFSFGRETAMAQVDELLAVLPAAVASARAAA